MSIRGSSPPPSCPQDKDIDRFKLILILAVIGMSISVLDLVHRQVNYDIFLLDWEKPRLTVTPGNVKTLAPVSTWRKLFVTNEFNELQTIRIANFTVTICTTGT